MHVKNEQLNTINNLNEIKIKLQYQVKKHLGDFTNKPKKKNPITFGSEVIIYFKTPTYFVCCRVHVLYFGLQGLF